MSGTSSLSPNGPRDFHGHGRGPNAYLAESVDSAYGATPAQKRPLDLRPQLPLPQAPMPPTRFAGSYQQRPELERSYGYRGLGVDSHSNRSAVYSPHDSQHGLDRYFPGTPANMRTGAELGQAAGSPSTEPQSSNSPKSQRKTKGHVASACVPCKRAHLRCDAQRPCSRCISNGKEDSCVDVQHKKRGRPRLRDDRDSRFETMRHAHAYSRDVSPRRPVDIHPSRGPPGPSGLFDNHYQRLQSFRTSDIAPGSGFSAKPFDRASSSESNSYNTSLSINPGSPEPVAYLTMSLDFVKGSSLFWDALSLPNMTGRNLGDIILPAELEKVSVIHSHFNTEQRRREPNYLPPILGHGAHNIQGLGFAFDDFARFHLNFQDQLVFTGANRLARPVPIRAGLAKEGSFYFIILLLVLPAGQTPHNSPSVTNGQGGQTGLAYQRPSPESVLSHRAPFDPIRGRAGETVRTANAYREQRSPNPSSRPSSFIEYGLGQTGRLPTYNAAKDKQMQECSSQRGMSLESATPKHPNSQSGFQLPPIRPTDDRAGPLGTLPSGNGERSSRVDIDGLLGDSQEPYRPRDDDRR